MVAVILLTILLYVIAGLIFAVLFISCGMVRIDPVAHGAPWSFRVLMIPGSAALWPLLAVRWRQASHGRAES